MSGKWVVNLSTNIGTDANQFCVPDFTRKCFCFDEFADARDKAREIIRSYAFEDSCMFDGNGRMKAFEWYIDNALAGFEDDEDLNAIYTGMKKVSELFEKLFSGENVNPEDEAGGSLENCTDYMIAAEFVDGRAIKIYATDEGQCNGVDPCIYSDMFDMTEPGNYILYIADSFDIDNYNIFSVEIMKAK